MYGNASYLPTFRLMPLEEPHIEKIRAEWTYEVVDMNNREVAFTDLSLGEINSWQWDFGDGSSSCEQNPTHRYLKAGLYVVTLYVEGPEGKSRMAKVWDVAVK
jgi:hypothetical protein